MKKIVVLSFVMILLCAAGVFAKQVPGSFSIAVWDNGPASDIVLSTKIISELGSKDYDVPIGLAKLFSEIDLSEDDQMILVIYSGETVLVTGDSASSSLVAFGSVISSILNKIGVNQLDPLLISELPSDDLVDIFEQSDNAQEDEEEGTEDEEPKPVLIREPREEPKEEQCKSGCLLDEICYAAGYRESGKFCSDEGTFKMQLSGNNDCSNNFECISNICIDNKCINQGTFKKFMNWFRSLFG